jgi:rare lipoprotein A
VNPRLVWPLVAALLSACAANGPQPGSAPKPPAEQRDGAPAEVPYDLALLPDPVPRHEEKSRYGNPATYTVNGRTYRVLDDAAGYLEEGFASWYGTKFHGRRTSSGEPYDMFQLTAAHKQLPVPSYARVTRLDTGQAIIVRVNDRGPFHDDRIIDLSYAAAVKLGVAQHGTTRVRVESLIAPSANYFLQAGAFRVAASADRRQRTLTELTGVGTKIVKTPRDSLYRVRVGPVAGEAEARRLQSLITGARLEKPIIVAE